MTRLRTRSTPSRPRRAFRASTLAAASALCVAAGAQSAGANGDGTKGDEVEATAEAGRPVIAEALAAVGEDVRVYNDHLTILASPWMEGRLPGTRGMELAKEYMEFQFRASGLVPPLYEDVENPDGTISVRSMGSYRQPFNLGASNEIRSASLALDGARHVAFEHGADSDFTVTGLGVGGEVAAPAVFVGYAVEDGPEGFTSFHEGRDLTGKVAVLLRFEPMDEGGKSLWTEGRRGWTRRAGFNAKLEAVSDRGAVAAIIVNTPGAHDPRVESLLPPGGGGRDIVQIPVLHMTTEAGRRLVESATGGRRTLGELRDAANAGPVDVDLDGTVELHADIERVPVVAENVIALLPGRGRLEDEYIVIGAHLDHLGMGEFGSRDRENRGKLLHPGADDNASGSAGILLIADKMARAYREAGDEAHLRSILFMGFSAEESGLNGSRYYANNPIYPIEKHVLMMNFDMIGRIEERRLSLSGARTGAGLAEFLQPIVDASPLEVVQPDGMSGASDHTSFQRKKIPVLFAIIADFHADYHTPRDVSSLINRVDAVHAANLFYEIALAAAQRPEAFPFVDADEARRRDRRRR